MELSFCLFLRSNGLVRLVGSDFGGELDLPRPLDNGESIECLTTSTLTFKTTLDDLPKREQGRQFPPWLDFLLKYRQKSVV